MVARGHADHGRAHGRARGRAGDQQLDADAQVGVTADSSSIVVVRAASGKSYGMLTPPIAAAGPLLDLDGDDLLRAGVE